MPMHQDATQKIDIEALDQFCRLFEFEVVDMLEFTDEQA